MDEAGFVGLFPQTAAPTADQIAKENAAKGIFAAQIPYAPIANAVTSVASGVKNWAQNLQKNVATEEFIRSQGQVPQEAPLENDAPTAVYEAVNNLPATPGLSLSNIAKQTALGFVGATSAVDRELRAQDVVDASVGLTGIRASQAALKGPAALVNADRSGLSTFLGHIPKNAPKEVQDAFRLRQMQAETALMTGEDPKSVWAKYGFIRDPRGNLITEISDETMSINAPAFNSVLAKATKQNIEGMDFTDPNVRKAGETTLGEIVNHDSFFKVFPDAKGIKVRLGDTTSSEVSGYFRPDPRGINQGEIVLNIPRGASKAQVLEVIAHEMQHIAQYEDVMVGLSRATGTNSEQALKAANEAIEYAGDLRRFYSGADDQTILQSIQKYAPHNFQQAHLAFSVDQYYKKMLQQYPDNPLLKASIGHAYYRANPGEIEANLVMERLRWTSQDRRANMPDFSGAVDIQRKAEEAAAPQLRDIRARADRQKAEATRPGPPPFGKRNRR